MTPSPFPLYPPILTPIAPTLSVWDIEDKELEDRALLSDSRSMPSTPHPEALMVKVYETLNALCAEWVTTALSTAETIVVQSVELLRLDISLEAVVTEEGLTELRNRTIPAIVHLLMMISETI
ncbi:hypothetical protein Moror_14411 [Moniliophthora roreri MCA 2997]|uniref:Uncharacterized protein n=1 Tax=Moniliophthora roreri (strain MCA 2997) TaxID=1381753 RepID=V2W6Q8_MONRO|nr:hypothetical protein Moror_14411 [Moniliophthora roreri MCA 2997]